MCESENSQQVIPSGNPVLTTGIFFASPSWCVEERHIMSTIQTHTPGRLFPSIDYSYRPLSYWDVANLDQLVANIKGSERKKIALRLIREERLDEAKDFILDDSLSEEERVDVGKVHPALMGGEYLPDCSRGEVEIARVTMASTTQDVISIRAFPKRGRIFYRVQDEYESVFEFEPSSSKLPLSLLQLIHLIDSGDSDELGPIGLGIIQIQFDCSEEPVEFFADFMEFTSEFYPELNEHYRLATQQWVADTTITPCTSISRRTIASTSTKPTNSPESSAAKPWFDLPPTSC